MGYVRTTGDAIWTRGIEGDPALVDQILSMAPGETIDLEIEGVVGTWEKMKNGRDGRETRGIRPIGPMREVWRSVLQRRGSLVKIRRVARSDPYLAYVQSLLAEEWDSPEDDEAFRDLPMR